MVIAQLEIPVVEVCLAPIRESDYQQQTFRVWFQDDNPAILTCMLGYLATRCTGTSWIGCLSRWRWTRVIARTFLLDNCYYLECYAEWQHKWQVLPLVSLGSVGGQGEEVLIIISLPSLLISGRRSRKLNLPRICIQVSRFYAFWEVKEFVYWQGGEGQLHLHGGHQDWWPKPECQLKYRTHCWLRHSWVSWTGWRWLVVWEWWWWHLNVFRGSYKGKGRVMYACSYDKKPPVLRSTLLVSRPSFVVVSIWRMKPWSYKICWSFEKINYSVSSCGVQLCW